MKEEFLHYVWKYQMFSSLQIKTTSQKSVQIQNIGLYNTNAGPDFLNAKILIDDVLWVGHVEIHVKSSDWYLHKHENDTNYDTVILHIVWEEDIEVFRKNNQQIETVKISEYIKKNMLDKYYSLVSNRQHWIPCEKSISQIDNFIFNQWKERLFFGRLERKSIEINQLLQKSNNDFEAVLFILVCKNFGLKVNGEAFFNLAISVPFSVVRKAIHNKLQLAALLFGQAGFLVDDIENEYYRLLKNEYTYLQRKFNLKPVLNSQFQFFRMRPANFPTIRIAQIIATYLKHQQLFSKLMSISEIKDFYELFDIELDTFWNTHYTFEKESPKRKKKISKSMVDLLLINTVVPLKFTYLKSRGEVIEEDFLELLIQLKPEKNRIIDKFNSLKIKASNAFETQALLELKNNYCVKKQCLQCAIGNSILKG